MKELEQIFATNTVQDLEGQAHPLDSNVSYSEAQELRDLVKKFNPGKSLEIGFAKGISALAILEGLKNNPNSKHYIIDPFQKQFYYCGLAMVKNCGFDGKYEFFEKFPEEVIPSLEALDFAFIDASHLFDLTLMEFVLVDKKLRKGGIVGFHDMWMPSLQKVLRYIIKNRNYRVLNSEGFSPTGFKGGVVKLLQKFPRSSHYFSTDLLEPFSMMNIPNMVFIEKTANDSRDWKHHIKF